MNLQKKEATNYGTDWTVPRGAAGVCALCWGEPAQSEVRPWGGEGRGGGECVPVPSPRNPPLVPPQLLVGCRDRSVKLFSTEKGKFRESRVCPGGDGPFCGLAAYGRYRRGGGAMPKTRREKLSKSRFWSCRKAAFAIAAPDARGIIPPSAAAGLGQPRYRE